MKSENLRIIPRPMNEIVNESQEPEEKLLLKA